MSRVLYEHGNGTTTDVLDAQLALERARVNAARAKYEYLVSHAAFEFAAGL